MAARMASVPRAIARLEERFRTNTSRAFVLVEGYEEERKYLPPSYDPDAIQSMWQFQMKLNQGTMSQAGLRRYVNPPAEHLLPRFRGSKGTRSYEIVGDANLRHLLRCSNQEDVDVALGQFDNFDPNDEVAITDEDSAQQMLNNYAAKLTRSLKKVPAFKKFGDLKVVYTGRRTGVEHPDGQNLHPIPPSTVRVDGLFSVLFRSANQQRVEDYESFSLLSLELKAAQIRATAGIPFSGYCRPGTDDARGVQTIRHGPDFDEHREDNACKNFQHTVTQAFQGAVLNKCQLVGTMDAAGQCLMRLNWDMIEGLDEALAAVRNDALDQALGMRVRYDQVHCVHWEEGTFWKDLTCAIVNQLYAQFPELRGFLDQYSRVQRRLEHPRVLDRYRNISRGMESHQQAQNLYERCGEYYSITSRARGHAVLERFGEFVEHGWEEHQILETFHESGDDIATSVYKVSHPAINNHRPFVAKLHNFDDKGELLFLNELEIYRRLMGQNADPRRWPLLLEFGLVYVNGTPYYYLAMEYLDGEEPNYGECKECAKELVTYGVFHDDVKTSNFVKVKHGSRKIVKAIDFGVSTMLPEARDSTKAAPIFEGLRAIDTNVME